MRSGLLRERVELQSATEEADSYGQVIRTWSTYATVQAGVEEIDESEAQATTQIYASRTHRVTLRYNPDVTAGHRILWGSRVLNVSGVTHDRRRTQQTLACTEVTL